MQREEARTAVRAGVAALQRAGVVIGADAAEGLLARVAPRGLI